MNLSFEYNGNEYKVLFLPDKKNSNVLVWKEKPFKFIIHKEQDGSFLFDDEKSSFPKDFNVDEVVRLISFEIENRQTVQNEGFDDEETEIEVESEDFQEQPYNPEQIRVETKSFSLHQIHQMMTEYQDIDLSPDFQRSFVWTDLKRRSRLIESILLRIPLPVFYFSSDKQGRMQVVDGVQRLSVIKQFLNGEFKLTKLEYLKECNGLYFSTKIAPTNSKALDPMYVRRILQTQVVVNIIDHTSPSKVKYDIFKRINTGGKPLNAQEIRNCIATPLTRSFLKKMVQLSSFKKVSIGVNETRMMDQELAMRFIGFYLLFELKHPKVSYRSSMDNFLDEILDILNGDLDNHELNQILTAFDNSMENAHYLFGQFAFRKCFTDHLKDKKRKAFLNKALFTSWSIVLSTVPHSRILEEFKESSLIEPLASELSKKEDYFRSVQIATNTASNLYTAFDFAHQILKKGRHNA
jgi:hypothetical protein